MAPINSFPPVPSPPPGPETAGLPAGLPATASTCAAPLGCPQLPRVSIGAVTAGIAPSAPSHLIGRAGGAAPLDGTPSPGGWAPPPGPEHPYPRAEHPSLGQSIPTRGTPSTASPGSPPTAAAARGEPPPLGICLQGARRQRSLRGCSVVIKRLGLLIFQA